MEDFLKYGDGIPKNTRDLFERTIKSKNSHVNKKYFIIKTIILNNLYGVDIMNEAVETTKLRLFLSLVATASPNYSDVNIGIEPLPDIDFNIKCGNTLIGYSTREKIETSIYSNIFNILKEKEVFEKLQKLSAATRKFRDLQLTSNKDRLVLKLLKEDLKREQSEVNNILNRTLNMYDNDVYNEWLKRAQPFNWFSEFYNIISKEDGKGGFDVIIGNPPYVEYSSVHQLYDVEGYDTKKCGNLYAYVLERCKELLNDMGIIGMIVPLSGHSTDRMKPLVNHFYDEYPGRYLLNLSGDANPSRLFPGVKFRLAVFFVSKWFIGNYSTKYKKWYADEREFLFKNISYINSGDYTYKNILVKTPSNLFASIFKKVTMEECNIWLEKGNEVCYYHNAPVSWIRAHSFTPYFCSERDGEGITTQLKKLTFSNKHDMIIASSLLNSTLFYIWWVAQSDCYHLNHPEIKNFGFTIKHDEIEDKLVEISYRLAEDMQKKSCRRVYHYKTSGRVEYDEFYMKKSKDLIDEIDKALAEHYGFSELELDFILNYEIKYRIGVQDVEKDTENHLE